MTELAIPEARPVAPYAAPAAQLPVPAMSDVDSWTQIVREVVKLASEIYDTPFVPDGLRGSAAAVSACILAGREMGLGPMTSLANIDVIKGKPTQKPLLMRAMIQSRGHKWEEVEANDFRAVLRGCRKGESTWTTITFTADQARKAGIDLGKYPADKLYARASSRLAKHKFADVIMGMAYSSDEVEDGLDAEIVVDTATGELTTGTPAIEAAKPRTARRAAPKNASPAPAATTPGAAPPSAERAGEALPPLPGEEEADPTPSAPASADAGPSRQRSAPSSATSPASSPAAPDDTDYDTHGTATRGKGGQLTALWTILTKEFGYADTEADKTHARTVCEYIINRQLDGGTTGDLSYNEARTVLDTLSHWQHQAAKEKRHPREYMTALMMATDEAAEGE